MNDDVSMRASPPDAPAGRENTVLDWARREGAADLLVRGLDAYLRRRRRRRIMLGSAGGAALLIALTFSIPFRAEKLKPNATADAHARTPAPVVAVTSASATILRPERQTLADGSTVELNADAEIEVAFSAAYRRVVLRKGEAHFQVAKNPQRPFIVAAGAIEVRAVGTGFDVEIGQTAVDVLVTEGRVTVNAGTSAPIAGNESGETSGAGTGALADESRPAAAASPEPLAALDAGRRIVIEGGAAPVSGIAPRVSEVSPADMQARLAWRVPRLKFAATPLEEVVAMFNAHAVAGRDPRLVLAADAPTDARVSGMLRSDDVESLLRLLEAEFGISAEKRPGEIVLRRQR